MMDASRKQLETMRQMSDITCDTTDISLDATTRTIACDIHKAVYTPSQVQPSLSARASLTSRAVQVKSARHERLESARGTQATQGVSLPQLPALNPFSPLYIRLNDDAREPLSPFQHMLRIFERVLDVALFVVLLAIAVAVIAAERSQAANAQIMHLLHVDIRTEIAYLVHLAGQLHW